ncbi:MAG: rRNA maturation RNase YbeY [Erysipelotrichales bacterium]|nr:rRNA maturation RNase YbeY [Erysipelotrichales bacterium]
MELTIINQTSEKKWNSYRKDFMKILSKTCEVLKCDDDFAMSLIFVDDGQIQEINREYREKDMPTDVISFALNDVEDPYDLEDTNEIGDIFINVQAIVRQAMDYQHTYRREVCFLFTHGVLHLMGYDHMCEEDEKEMFALQDIILEDIAKKRYVNYENHK